LLKASEENTLESYLKYALGFGIALGSIGFVIGWWRSLPPPEAPWHGPDLKFLFAGLFFGILVGSLVNYVKRTRKNKESH